MTGSYSIFLKYCPACAMSVAIDSVRCECGHEFESSLSSASADEVALRDEEMYEHYLKARAEQAEQASRTALDAQAEDPANEEKAAAAALAAEVAKSILLDLRDQEVKVARLRKALVRTDTPQPTPLPAVPAPEARHTRAPTPVKLESVIPLAATATPPAVQLVVQLPAADKSRPDVSPAPLAAHKAAGALTALKQAKARQLAIRVRQAQEAALAQADAEKAARARATALEAAARAIAETKISQSPPNTFREQQAARAEKVMEAHQPNDSKECPNCTAKVPLTTGRCRCGFIFASASDDLPTLTLCTGDFTALRNNLNLNLRRRPS